MNSLVIVAYKPDSDDYCRGHVVEVYWSDFGLIESSDPDVITKFMAERMWRNTRLGYNEEGYKFYIIEGTLTHLPDDISEKAKTLVNDRLRREKLARKLEAERERQDELRMKELEERALLAELTAKYEK